MRNLTDPAPSSLDHKWANLGYLLVATSLFTLLILFLYFPTLRWLIHIWSIDEQYSHGFLVPFISLYLVWTKRDWLKQVPIRPAIFWGGVLIIGSICLLLLGRCGAFMHAESISFFFFLPGVVLFLFGWSFLKVLAIPLFYLQFMIPWLDPVFEKIQPFFQRVSAVIGSNLLELKYPVFVDNFYIHLPNISMLVAEECSGINFLVTILAIGLPLVYLTQKTWVRAFAILSIGCLLSILSNGLRVAIAGVMGEEYGSEMLHGPAHIFEGWFVAWVGWIGLFITNWLFGKIPYKKGEPQYHLYERWRCDENIPCSFSNNGPAIRYHFFVLLMLLFSFGAYLNFFALPKAVALNAPLQQFPLQIDDWRGEQNNWFESDTFFPQLDNKLSRMYRDKSGNVVYLFIGYYKKQDNDKRLISYLSSPLHHGSRIVSPSKEHLSFPVISSSLSNNLSRFDTVFWYQFSDNLKMIDRLHVKLHVLKSGILQRRNNGAIILIATAKKTNNDDPLIILQSFTAGITSLVDKFLP